MAGDHLHELPGIPFARALLALGVAFIAARPDARFDRWVALFVGWLTATGAIVIGAQLWQRYVPASDELRILIDPVTLSVTVASEMLLLVAGISLVGARRAASR